MSKTSPIIINEIRRLSQEEGLKDDEIADIIKYNKEMRKDKKVICPQCGNDYLIRRNEKPGICCPKCAEIANTKIEKQYCTE